MAFPTHSQPIDPPEITIARKIGLDKVPDTELLPRAEQAGFEVLLTTDKQMFFQQNLSKYEIALVVLGNQEWSIVQRYVRRIVRTTRTAKPGSYSEVSMPKY